MRKAKLSIIVPVYNVYEYLDKCLDSLTKQTEKNLEVIIINDGSPDNSQEIIEKYTKKYKNFTGYIKENGGLSDARNYGLKKAKTDYIAFLDGDDYVLPETYENLLKKFEEYDFDLVVCGCNMVFLEKIVPVKSGLKNDIFDKGKIKKNMRNIYPSAWNKVYNKRLFENNIRFKENVWYEDVEFIFRLYPFINSIGVVEEPFIQYIQRSGAITKTFDSRVNHYVSNWNGIVEFYKKNEIYNVYQKELEYSYVRYLYSTMIKAAMNFPDKDEYRNTVKLAIENVNKTFPKYRWNIQFYKSVQGIYMLVFNRCLADIMYSFMRLYKSLR